MALSVVDLYRDILPRTNCKDCGFPTCLAFAGFVVSEKHALDGCPHLDPDVVKRCNAELAAQSAAGKWTKRDMAEDALAWARQRSASMKLADLPERIGGALMKSPGMPPVFSFSYYTETLHITETDITTASGAPLTRWEKVFLYNHMAQGGRREPTGNLKGFEAFPNTVSKIKTMTSQVEGPLADRFHHHPEALKAAAARLGGVDATGKVSNADLALVFRPLPRVPLLVLFWSADLEDGFSATAKLLFDETVVEHLDIESIVFLSERLRQMLCDEPSDEKG
ncbi:DUF3786 domain-containing protein [Desulfosarcina sp. OttesenSCG-928-B08]|nr:DUF3786 domain-containing protein [Desulfosarcina sp. OttesenSCG-928-B08]